VLTARDTLNAAKRAEYLLLVSSASDPQPRSNTSSPAPGQRRRDKKAPQLTQEEREVNASSDVTLALRRTHDLMASELSRSQFAHDTLKESTAALAQLGETYSIMDTMLSSSKNLLGTLLRSQKSDTWYLETAFYVLCATIAWLVFRRFLYGPLWWFLWLPLRIFFRSLMGVLTGIGLIGGTPVGGVSSVASPVAGTQTVVHNSATRASRPSMPPRAHSVHVGGGGKGGPMKPKETPQGHGSKTVFEQVGRIIDEDQTNQGEDHEVADDSVEKSADSKEGEQVEAQRNPKKRMWEEEKEAGKQDRRAKDEL
jgi:protein transport protein SEC20